MGPSAEQRPPEAGRTGRRERFYRNSLSKHTPSKEHRAEQERAQGAVDPQPRLPAGAARAGTPEPRHRPERAAREPAPPPLLVLSHFPISAQQKAGRHTRTHIHRLDRAFPGRYFATRYRIFRSVCGGTCREISLFHGHTLVQTQAVERYRQR